MFDVATDDGALSEAQRELVRLRTILKAPSSAEELWRYHLSPAERSRLGDILEAAFFAHGGAAGMWEKLRGVSQVRSVFEVAMTLNFVLEPRFAWLLSEFGETVDADESSRLAIERGDLVFLENPRQVFWASAEVEVDWERRASLWVYLLQLARRSKGDQCIDALTFGDRAHHQYLAKQKSRLIMLPTFPRDLGRRIVSMGTRQQKLNVAVDRIRIFELDVRGNLQEWNP